MYKIYKLINPPVLDRYDDSGYHPTVRKGTSLEEATWREFETLEEAEEEIKEFLDKGNELIILKIYS